ncbi:MAG: type II toxin-antitoxin system RelE/ParE family toxin [Acidobacteriota bacterium]
MRLLWTDRAREDLLAIGHYIARDKPGAARAWVDRLKKRARQAASMPRAGRKLPELPRDDLREVIEHGYRIVYRILEAENQIHVLTVFESHRLLRRLELDDP